MAFWREARGPQVIERAAARALDLQAGVFSNAQFARASPAADVFVLHGAQAFCSF
jgi:hypothetical protein